jgi:hypothetical protein
MKPEPNRIPEPDISIHRFATVWMLRRYFNMSVELGRLPSMMGREVFRSRVQGKAVSFENVVVYVLDIERCLRRLPPCDQQLVTRVILQEYTQEEAARLLGWPVIKVERRLPEVLDILSERFLRLGMLKMPESRFHPLPKKAEAQPGDHCVPALSACIEPSISRFVSRRSTRKSDDHCKVPVEIFLSSPLGPGISANCHVQ